MLSPRDPKHHCGPSIRVGPESSNQWSFSWGPSQSGPSGFQDSYCGPPHPSSSRMQKWADILSCWQNSTLFPWSVEWEPLLWEGKWKSQGFCCHIYTVYNFNDVSVQCTCLASAEDKWNSENDSRLNQVVTTIAVAVPDTISLLEQLSTPLSIWHVSTDLANAFFSLAVNKVTRSS